MHVGRINTYRDKFSTVLKDALSTPIQAWSLCLLPIGYIHRGHAKDGRDGRDSIMLHFNEHKNKMGWEKQMTTTRELHAIVEELELVDIGDAASYLGECFDIEEESSISGAVAFSLDDCARTDNCTFYGK
jgi:hypothetical protein